jgi:hypothetical protein
MLISKSVKKVGKKCTKKVYRQNRFDKHEYKWKSAYFHHIFANNLFFVHFFNCFNGFVISMKFCIFDTHIEFLNLKQKLFLY